MIAHSSPELKQKLSLLKKKQRKVQDRYLWRSLVVSIFAGGILSTAVFNHWQIQQQSQIVVEGDRYINSDAIYDTLDIYYPQSAIAIPTQQIENQLKSIASLQSVRMTKTIFPPSVKITLQERIPVATAVSSGKVGFLDHQGVWLEPNLYNYPQTDLPLTKIKVTNFQPQYSSTWAKIYSLIAAYPTIDVREVRWDDVGNLFLVTRNVQVFLGANSSLLQKQFVTLASFPDLTSHQELENISQINLTNPDAPLIDRHNGTISDN